MKHLKSYRIFESVAEDLQDILLEINDETYWKAESWWEDIGDNPRDQVWVVVIQTVDEDVEYELEGQTPPPIVVESIERAIDFMNGEGFTNYQITFENNEEVHKGGSPEFEEITLEEVPDLDVWPNNFIRIEFWK